jgi:DNA gyrase subunit B
MSEKIEALNEKDKVRKKISIWLGSNNHLAVIHTVKELIGNSSDEINKGKGNQIKITLHEDKKTITIEDNCNGLPVEGVSKDTKQENYLLLTSVLFAGTKYQNGIDNQDYTVGTNGVFLTVLSRSSLFVNYEIARPDGKVYAFRYEKGDVSKPISVIGKSSKTYTKITYQLDDEIFEENFFTIEELCTIAEEQASLITGSIEVIDEETKECFEYELKNGISDLLIKYNTNKHHTNDLIQFSKEATKYVDKIKTNDNIKMNISMQYTQDSENNIQIEFLNGSNLTNHGTIQDGLIIGLKNVANSYLKANNAYKKDEKPIIKDDVTIGLNYLIEFKSFFPIYANQTKLSSHVTYYKDVVTKMIEEFFEIYAIENRSEMDKICSHVLLNKRLREKTDIAKLNLKICFLQRKGSRLNRTLYS